MTPRHMQLFIVEFKNILVPCLGRMQSFANFQNLFKTRDTVLERSASCVQAVILA
jgi:hypothetical protein